MPFVPVTVSRKNAAIVPGPSSWIVSSRMRERRLRVVLRPLRAVVRIEHVHDAGHRGLVRPATRIAGERHHAGGRPVVRPVARHDLVPSRDHAGDLDRVLVRLGAAERVEGLLDVAGEQLGHLLPEQRPLLVRHERRDVREALGLPMHRVGHAPVAVADVHAHQLAVEVDEALAVDAPEVDALRAIDRDRRRLGLRLPVVQRVALREFDDLLGRQLAHPPHPFIPLALDPATPRSAGRMRRPRCSQSRRSRSCAPPPNAAWSGRPAGVRRPRPRRSTGAR